MSGHNLPSVIGRVLFAAILGSSTLFARADELTGTPPSPPAVIGTEITANLVNIIFLFDRVASNPSRATTKNYLARVSERSSPLYPDYLEYQRVAPPHSSDSSAARRTMGRSWIAFFGNCLRLTANNISGHQRCSLAFDKADVAAAFEPGNLDF